MAVLVVEVKQVQKYFEKSGGFLWVRKKILGDLIISIDSIKASLNGFKIEEVAETPMRRKVRGFKKVLFYELSMNTRRGEDNFCGKIIVASGSKLDLTRLRRDLKKKK